MFFWMLHARNPALFDGGDAFGRVVAAVMVLAVTNAYLAPRARCRRERLTSDDWRSMVHNCAVVMIVLQLCVVYLSAGLFKATDPLWQSGTALFRVAQLEDYRFVDWVGLANNALFVKVITYVTIVLEVAFPFAIFTRFRRPIVLAMFAMHAVLAVLLGLVGFGLHMCAGLALLLDPDQERVVRLSAAVDLDLDAEPLADALAELVRVPLVDVGAVHERDE